jgi:hypothetical protein
VVNTKRPRRTPVPGSLSMQLSLKNLRAASISESEAKSFDDSTWLTHLGPSFGTDRTNPSISPASTINSPKPRALANSDWECPLDPAPLIRRYWTGQVRSLEQRFDLVELLLSCQLWL